MINQYIQKLIESLPEKYKNQTKPIKLDIIFDAGLFNGSYLVGVGLFLKELEKRNIIIVERISGCSIGAFISLLYISDNLEKFEEIYEYMLKLIKTEYNFKNYNVIFENLKPFLPENICEIMNKHVYIKYYNAKKMKKIIKFNYNSVDDIFNTITKSCFFPFIVNGKLTYKNKYIDGINPYIFPLETSRTEKKALFVNLHSINKTFNSINVRNEKNNFHRILTGVLDIHCFFMKECTKTDMCCFVNDWSCIDNVIFYGIRGLIENFILYFVFYFIFLREYFHENKYFKDILSNNNILNKIIVKVCKDIYVILLENYMI